MSASTYQPDSGCHIHNTCPRASAAIAAVNPPLASMISRFPSTFTSTAPLSVSVLSGLFMPPTVPTAPPAVRCAASGPPTPPPPPPPPAPRAPPHPPPPTRRRKQVALMRQHKIVADAPPPKPFVRHRRQPR